MDLEVVLGVVPEAVLEVVIEAALEVASEVDLEAVQALAVQEVGEVDSGWVEASPCLTARGLPRKRRKYIHFQEF